MMTQWLNAEYALRPADPTFVAQPVPSANTARLAASAFSKSNADNVSVTASNRIQQEPDLLERTLLAGLLVGRLDIPARRKGNDACLTQGKRFGGLARTFFPLAYNRRASLQFDRPSQHQKLEPESVSGSTRGEDGAPFFTE
jgi:hypothetical protein